jgi:hypothetical protein
MRKTLDVKGEKMIYLKKLCIAVVCLTILNNGNAFAGFIISGKSACSGGDVYSYKFYSYEYEQSPNLIRVKVSEYEFYPDITMKLVYDPREADLIFVDDLENANMKVCKSSSLSGAQTIKVSKYESNPNIKVKMSNYPSSPYYKIFISSKIFTSEEVAALFAVILKYQQ